MDKQIAGRVSRVRIILAALVLAAGVAIAWMDTRPRWDDTGVTVSALLVAAALGGLFGVRPWLAAILVAAPLLIAESASAGVGLLIAPAVAFAGAYGGAMGRHLAAGSAR